MVEPLLSCFFVLVNNVDESVKENFKNPDFDWRTCFQGTEEHGFGQKMSSAKKTAATMSQKAEGKVDTFLKQLMKQAKVARSEDKNKKKGGETKKSQPPPEQKDKRDSRTPNGWSYSAKKPRTGPLATCGGCEKAIKRDDERLKHKAILKKNEHPTIRFFHLRAACVKKAGSSHVGQFVNKKWTNIKVRDVQFQMEKEDDDSE